MHDSGHLGCRLTATDIAVALVCAVASLTVTGFKFGINNNVFHIPYVLSLSDSPEFAGDAIYSSLKYFTSIIWPALRLAGNESNIQPLFFVAHIASRCAAFIGIMVLIRTAGVNSVAGAISCMSVIAISPWFIGTSVVGGHGMFIGYFSHSEVTWIFVLLSLALMSRSEFTPAAAMTGITFSINAFVGLWLLFVNIFTVLVTRKSIGITVFAKAAGAFLVFAVPVAIWISMAIGDSGLSTNFSYIEYVRSYYPEHFLIEAASASAIAKLILLLICGLVATLYLPERIFWVSVQIACVSVFVAGVILPYVIDARFVFNLHLLRSDGLIQAVAILLTSIAGAKLFLSPSDLRRQFLGAVILFSLVALERNLAGLVIIAIALSFGWLIGRVDHKSDGPVSRHMVLLKANYITALIIFAFVAALIYVSLKNKIGTTQTFLLFCITGSFCLILVNVNRITASINTYLLVSLISTFCVGVVAKEIRWRAYEHDVQKNDPVEYNWYELVAWIRNSNLHGVFLIPLNSRSDLFQLQARRKVWVDRKQGAAVMWSPSFYSQWASRYREVSSLKSPVDAILYAREHKIPNVILESENGECPPTSTLVKRTGPFVICVA